MARELAQILQELDAVYQPQKDQYNKAITATDPTMQAEEQGLNQAKQDAFQGITDQANRRGMFYSGLPIAEQAKYTGTQFLPALANLRSRYAQQKFDLTNALNKVVQDQYTQAYGVRQHELDLEEQQREFDRRMAAEAAARAASAAGGGGGGGYSFGGLGGDVGGGGGGAPAARAAAAPAPVDRNKAIQAVNQLLSTKNNGLIQTTINAIRTSAQRGNAYDQAKMAYLQQLAPNNKALAGVLGSPIGVAKNLSF